MERSRSSFDAAHKRRPLERSKMNLFRWSQLTSDVDLPVLESIAVEETGELEALADPYVVMQVAQECAAGGVDVLRGELTGGRERNLLCGNECWPARAPDELTKSTASQPGILPPRPVKDGGTMSDGPSSSIREAAFDTAPSAAPFASPLAAPSASH